LGLSSGLHLRFRRADWMCRKPSTAFDCSVDVQLKPMFSCALRRRAASQSAFLFNLHIKNASVNDPLKAMYESVYDFPYDFMSNLQTSRIGIQLVI
jgi:hypothetical protein